MSRISPIFNRAQASEHVLSGALKELINSSNDEDRAMAANLMYDPRVSELREREFLQFGIKPGAPPNKQELQKAQINYFEQNVCYAKQPAFQSDSNKLNLVFRGGLTHWGPHLKLVRLLDVNRLDLVFSIASNANWTTKSGNKPFRRYPLGGADSSSVTEWLNQHLDNTDEQAAAFVSDVFELLNYRLDTNSPYHSNWVGFWDELGNLLLRENADRWLERFGIYRKTSAPHWIIALVYTFEDAREAFRPTILDTNWGNRHFPSPPSPKARAGHPMDLDCSSTNLAHELIHPQIRHDKKHFADAEFLRKKTSRISPENLREQRLKHRELLRIAYNDLGNGWMP